jgi:hypothetical protein
MISTIEKEISISREVLVSKGNKIRITDSDKDACLDVFCYSSCDNNEDDIIKQCRGIVFNGDRIVLKAYSYTPEYTTSSDSISSFINSDSYTNISDYKCFDSYEGTLIRVFNWNDKWYVTTHKKLNAFKSKWGSKDSFGKLFKDAISHEYEKHETFYEKLQQYDDESFYDKFLYSLNTSYQYMFLLRSTQENRIVCDYPTVNKLYHTGTFINNGSDHVFDIDIGIPRPTPIEFSDMESIIKYVDNADFRQIQGIIMFKGNKQWKIINNEYNELYDIRGNEASIKYRYLQVRMDRDMTDKLYYLYPDYASVFDEYENSLYTIARNVYTSYINRYIHKQYISLPVEEYSVMKKCHEWHRKDREHNRISLRKVIEITNTLSATCLNKMIKRLLFPQQFSSNTKNVSLLKNRKQQTQTTE